MTNAPTEMPANATRSIVLRQVNVAEAIVAPLFDAKISNAAEFQVSDEIIGERELTQGWDSSFLRSSAGIVTVDWNGSVLLGDYDALRFFITVPPDVTIDGTAEVDGERVAMFDNIAGELAPLEATSSRLISEGRPAVVSSIRLTLHNPSCCEFEAHIRWIAVVNTRHEHLIEEALPRYTSQWNGLLNPTGSPFVRTSLYFDPADCAELKSRLTTECFRESREQIMSAAREWGEFDPEPQVREFVACAEHLYRYVRVRDRGRIVLEDPMMVLAIAGYLCDRPDWSRRAARMMLSIAHTPHWFEGNQSMTPGSEWHHVCFMEDHYVSAMSTALQFIGDCLTPQGLKLVLDRIEEAWSVINEKCEEPGYRWHMNQGLVGNRGRILGAITLYNHGRGEKYREAAETAYRDHTTVFVNYLNEEGHCFEGPLYYANYSLPTSIQLWASYATLTGRDISEVVPGCVHRSTTYMDAMMSSVDPYGATVPINSSGTGKRAILHSLPLAFLATVCGWERGYDYLEMRARDGDATTSRTVSNGLDVLFLLRYLPEGRHQPLPTRRAGLGGCLASGLMAYDFLSPASGKLWFLCERNAVAGHHHYDRGSIVLEANGEILLLDPGITNYSHPMTQFMMTSEWHNMAYVSGTTMNLHAPPKEPSARLEYAEATAKGVRFAGDSAPAINLSLLLARRQGDLEVAGTSGTLRLIDTWELLEVVRLRVAFQSYSPWTIEGQSATIQRGNTQLTVTIRSADDGPIALATNDRHIDGNTVPVYTLLASADKGKRFELISTVTWKLVA